MSTECYRVKVPEGTRLTGSTLAGQRVTILPGEYHVHRLPPKAARLGAAALRFVGAHGRGSDVYIKLPDGADMSKVLSIEVQPVEAS
jgi:hypothetical protein